MCMFLDCSSWFMKEIATDFISCKASRTLQSNFRGRTKWLDTEQNGGESDECSGEDFGTVYRVGKISTCPILGRA